MGIASMRRWSLATVAFLAVIDLSVVAIALPAIRQDLGFSVAGVQWVMTGYALVQGGLLLVAGRIADRLGRRRVLVFGLLMFTVCSVGAAAAMAPWMLVAARIGQGIGGAAMLPSALALLVVNSEEGRRQQALGLFSAMSGLGFVTGVIISGLLTHYVGWRAVMLLSVPVAAAVVPVVLHVVPESSVPGPRRTIDAAGALLLTAGIGVFIFAVSRIESAGIGSSSFWAGLALSGMLFVALTHVERKSPDPVLPLAVLRDPVLKSANTANVLKSAVGMAQLYVLTLFLQDVLGASPVRTGVLFVPMALASVGGANIAGRFQDRLGGIRRTALMGCLVLLGGLVLLSTQLHRDAAIVGIVLAMIIIEGGFMMAEVPLNLAATTSVPQQQGLAAGILNTTTELGNALGLGLTAAVVGLSTSGLQQPPSEEALAAGLRHGLGVAMAATVIATAVVLLGLGRRRKSEIER